MLFRKLRWALIGLPLMLLIGSAGYHFIEGWSWFDGLWMVVISLTTIGYGEVHELSFEGRVFTLGLITVGFGLVTYTFTQITRYVVEGGLRQDLIERRRRVRMRKLHDHVIVIGYGRLGHEVVDELTSRGVQVCVIDQRTDVMDHLPDLAVHLCGDGTHDAVLIEAGLERARGIAIATPHSATNVYVTLAARQLNPDIAIVTRIDDTDAVEKARRAGATRLVTPFGVGGQRMAQGLLHPQSTDFLEQVVTRHSRELDLQDVAVGEDSTTWHGTLAELDLRRRARVLVVAIRRPDGELLPTPDPLTEVMPGDVLVVVGAPADVLNFKRQVG